MFGGALSLAEMYGDFELSNHCQPAWRRDRQRVYRQYLGGNIYQNQREKTDLLRKTDEEKRRKKKKVDIGGAFICHVGLIEREEEGGDINKRTSMQTFQPHNTDYVSLTCTNSFLLMERNIKY